MCFGAFYAGRKAENKRYLGDLHRKGMYFYSYHALKEFLGVHLAVLVLEMLNPCPQKRTAATSGVNGFLVFFWF